MVMRSFVLLLITLCAVTQAAQPQLASGTGYHELLQLAKEAPLQAFQLWVTHHARKYADEQEYKSRFGVWVANVDYINAHAASGSSMKLALNEFADMTWEEFSSQRLGFLGEKALELKAKRRASNRLFRYAATEASDAVNWVEKGAVTDVKNQGQCGSCWSFATTGAIEGVNYLKTGELVALSEEQLVDCDTEHDMGCSGGLMDWAYEYVVKNGGLDTEADYAYWSGWGMTLWRCNRRKEHDRTVVTIDGYEDVPADEDSLAKAVTHQPVSVGICASMSMQFYSHGVIDDCCDGLNHGVLVAGYGTESDGTPYWLVKNSWGEAWGMDGYFKLKRGVSKGGLCGVATAASYPVKNTPNKPVPQMCDIFGWNECGATQTCSCSFNLFGFWCLWHDCCPLEQGVTCDDGVHCCPGHMPNCDTKLGVCMDDAGASVPWTPKTKAQAYGRGEGAPAMTPAQQAAELYRRYGKSEPLPVRPHPPQ